MTNPALTARGNADTLPDPGAHARTWNWLMNLATESDRVRRREANFELFDERLDMFYGKHWPETIPSFKPPIVVNELRTLILQEASDLSESQLRIYVLKDPKKGGRDEQAERALRALWSSQEVDLKILTEVVWALVLGTGFMRVIWDPNEDGGMGNVGVHALDPRNVLPDPDAMDDKNMAYVMIESYHDLAEIRRVFPVAGMMVKPENRFSVSDNRQRVGQDPSSWATYIGPMTEGDSLLGRSIEGYKKARARVLDCLVKDDSTTTEVVERDDRDEEGNRVLEYKKVPRYPNGRRIVGANGVVLFDGDNPNPSGDFGLLRVVLEPTLGRFWGQGFVQQTAQLQIAADKMMSSVVENAIRLNNGIVKMTTTTGLDIENFAGIPGQVVTINPGSNFEIMYPPAMPPDMVQAPWRMLDMQRRILGFPDVRSGSGGRGNVSAELTETDISQAMGLTRLRSRMIYGMVRRLAEMIFAHMAFGYTTPRTIPATEGEQFKPVIWEPLDKPELYRTYVPPESLQVMSRTMLKRLGLALFKLRGIDRQSLLEMLGWPDWESVSGRMAQAEEAAAKMKVWETQVRYGHS